MTDRKTIARVFPSRTNATPTDDLAFVGPPGLFPPTVDEVHVSVTFTWDIPKAKWLARQWEHIAPTKIGGPAMNDRGMDFISGKYLKPGYVITSRGCPNNCWFCSVWKREGVVRELPITDGYNLLDDNILACSDSHIKKTIDMLSAQKERPQITGGLEAKRLLKWHAIALREIKPKQVFFAYDNKPNLSYLERAGGLMLDAGFTIASHVLRAYVLCGYPTDTTERATKRMSECIKAGFGPMAMFYRAIDKNQKSKDWAKFQRKWARPAMIYSRGHRK